MKPTHAGRGGMSSSLARGRSVRSLYAVVRGGVAPSLRRRCIVRISRSCRMLSEGEHGFGAEIFSRGFGSAAHRDAVVLLERCARISSGVICTGVFRSRIRDSFVPAGRKLRGFSFESSSNLLDKRGNHGRFAKLQLDGEAKRYGERKQSTADNAYQGIGY